MIKQVHEIDPLVCPRCGGEMRVIAFIIDPQVVAQILRVSPPRELSDSLRSRCQSP